jgi:hypothetical protein
MSHYRLFRILSSPWSHYEERCFIEELPATTGTEGRLDLQRAVITIFVTELENRFSGYGQSKHSHSLLQELTPTFRHFNKAFY